MSENKVKFVEKIKTNKKFRTQFIGIAIACAVVLATGITVPTVMHNNKIKAEQAQETSSTEAVSETTTAEATTLPDGIETVINEDNGTTAIVGVTDENGNYVYTTVPTTAKIEETTKKAENSGTTKAPNTTKKPTATKPATTAQTVEQTTQWLWTEADLQDVVNQAKAYATSKGIVIDSSLSEVGTTWLNPVTTDWCRSKARAIQGVKYQIDEAYNDACKNGYDPSWGPFSINIFYKPWNSIATYPEDTCWGIYVVM